MTRYMVSLTDAYKREKYHQNCKELTNYYRKIDNSELPLQQGYILDETEMGLRKYIMDIACKGSVIFEPEHAGFLKL